MLRECRWGDVGELRYGKALKGYHSQAHGLVRVFGTNGPVGFTDEPQANGPGVIIGRKGAYRGVHYSEGPFWVIDTAYYLVHDDSVDGKWAYYSLRNTDINGLGSGSAIPSTTREDFYALPVGLPPLPEQRAIAEVLGALDDKIAANTKHADTATVLSGLIYKSQTAHAPARPLSEILEPILGGTPARSRTDYWDGDHLWASAKDITGASFGVVADTAEKITELAVKSTKAKPAPIGSVILTARGTVGAVARLSAASSFNQSCYGFIPGKVPAGVLYHGILGATQRAKAIAHGSVFDTITKRTFDHLTFPDLSESASAELESRLSPLLSTIDGVVKQNTTLAATRDVLLPQLMSGKLRVRDAEALASAAV